MTCKFQVEIDPFCRAVLAKHWPDVRRYEDVRDVGAHNLEPVDVLCGGFPCQDISLAGKGAGIAEGTRSGLWAEYARLIGELRPRYVLVENVAALLARGRGFGRVLGDLATCGYDAEWDCIPANAVGAPHERDRVWIIAHARGEQHKVRGVALRWATSAQLPEAASHLDHQRQLQPQGRKSYFGGRISDSAWWATEPDVERVVYGVPGGVDRLRGLGNAIVPQIAEWLGRRIIEAAE